METLNIILCPNLKHWNWIRYNYHHILVIWLYLSDIRYHNVLISVILCLLILLQTTMCIAYHFIMPIFLSLSTNIDHSKGCFVYRHINHILFLSLNLPKQILLESAILGKSQSTIHVYVSSNLPTTIKKITPLILLSNSSYH